MVRITLATEEANAIVAVLGKTFNEVGVYHVWDKTKRQRDEALQVANGEQVPEVTFQLEVPEIDAVLFVLGELPAKTGSGLLLAKVKHLAEAALAAENAPIDPSDAAKNLPKAEKSEPELQAEAA